MIVYALYVAMILWFVSLAVPSSLREYSGRLAFASVLFLFLAVHGNLLF